MADVSSVHFSGADRYIQAAMSGLSARQRATASNVANVDTPNFKASQVKFEDRLRDALEGRSRLSDAPQATLNARMTEANVLEGTQVRADGNNVDIDREMVQLAETTLMFSTLSQVMQMRMQMMRSVIAGR